MRTFCVWAAREWRSTSAPQTSHCQLWVCYCERSLKPLLTHLLQSQEISNKPLSLCLSSSSSFPTVFQLSLNILFFNSLFSLQHYNSQILSIQSSLQPRERQNSASQCLTISAFFTSLRSYFAYICETEPTLSSTSDLSAIVQVSTTPADWLFPICE